MAAMPSRIFSYSLLFDQALADGWGITSKDLISKIKLTLVNKVRCVFMEY